MPCSCGEWVVPAIGLAKARVDVVDRLRHNTTSSDPPATGTGAATATAAVPAIRFPPGMRPGVALSGTGAGRGNL